MKYGNNKNGFTIVELLVVIGLIAILMTIVLTNLSENKDLARDQARVSDLQAIQIGLEQYRAACFEYPNRIYKGSGNAASNGRCPSGVDLDTFLAYVPVDVDGSEYQYVGLSNVVNGTCYDYHLAAQLEYDVDNNFQENYLLKEDHDYTSSLGNYRQRCSGSNSLIDIESDDRDGLYDVRSTKSYE